MYEQNCFLTLTYSEENLPEGGNLEKEELQKFIKRLRKKIEPIKIRYFGAGEYGDQKKRPHYHLCIFNYDFPDKEVYSLSGKNREFPVYISPTLQELWPFGYHTIGEVSMASAGYIARYVVKKHLVQRRLLMNMEKF